MIMNEAPLVLALDTSTVVNVGLARGDQVLATATVADQMAHVEQLMPLVSECVDAAGIRMADLDQLIVGLGPGPFTGLRVGVVTAQVLSYALGLELRGVCSLDVLAAQFVGASHGEFVVATDARRREVYWARYSPLGVRLEQPRSVTAERRAAAARHRTCSRPLRRSAASRARSAIDGSRRCSPRPVRRCLTLATSRSICGTPMRPS